MLLRRTYTIVQQEIGINLPDRIAKSQLKCSKLRVYHVLLEVSQSRKANKSPVVKLLYNITYHKGQLKKDETAPITVEMPVIGNWVCFVFLNSPKLAPGFKWP